MSLGEEEEEGEDREVQVQEGGRGEPPPEESKLSRLFYLQLYSSVLNAEKAHKKREKERRRKERRSLKLKLAKMIFGNFRGPLGFLLGHFENLVFS